VQNTFYILEEEKAIAVCLFSAGRNGNCVNLLKYTYSLLKDDINSFEYMNLRRV